MDADDLRIVEAVARIGSMNRAAAELNMVQSNVTPAFASWRKSSAFNYSSGTAVVSSRVKLVYASFPTWSRYVHCSSKPSRRSKRMELQRASCVSE